MDQLLTHRFGANYTPTRNWFHCWNDFDAASISRDLDAIAGLGLDHLRMMTIWPYFQPDATWVSPAHLERLDAFLTLAGERNLDIQVVMLNGWMSGYSYRPVYVDNARFYTSPQEFAKQSLYFREVAPVVNAHANFLGFDLGNEISCCWSSGTDLAIGDAWYERIADLMDEVSPGRIHVNGEGHGPWFYQETFSPAKLATRPKIVPLHCWIYFTEALKRGGPLDPPCARLAAGMAALARAHAGDPTKPIWVQEFGACSEWIGAELLSPFTEAIVTEAIREGVSWFTWWCSHDLDRKFSFASLEYDLGLLTVDNKVKPHGLAYKALADAYRGKPVSLDRAKATALPPPTQLNMDATWAWLLDWMGR